MKKQKLILICIIFLGLILSIAIINNNINIIKETKVIKTMSESEQVTNLQEQINQLNASHTEYAKNVESFKNTIIEAITNEGIATSITDSQETVVANIGKIFKTRTTIAEETAATKEDIAAGKQAYVNGELITGTVAPSSNSDDLSIGFYGNIYSGSSGYNQAGANGRFIFDCSNYSSYEVTEISYRISNNGTGQVESTSGNSYMNLIVYDGDTNSQLSFHGYSWNTVNENLNVKYDISNVSKIRLDFNSAGHNAYSGRNYTVQGTIVFHK